MELPAAAVAELSATSKATIMRLVSYSWDPPDLSVSRIFCLGSRNLPFFFSSAYPRSRLAAVLVLLYEEFGELRVLLTTRSKALRTHAGQTALPGGRADESDADLVQTAVGPPGH